jgi:hypothetical protein
MSAKRNLPTARRAKQQREDAVREKIRRNRRHKRSTMSAARQGIQPPDDGFGRGAQP